MLRVINERNMRRYANAKLRSRGWIYVKTFRSLDRAMEAARAARCMGIETKTLSFPRTRAHSLWLREG